MAPAATVALLGGDARTHEAIRGIFEGARCTWRLESYSTVEEALRGIRARRPNAVLMDLWAPGAPGIRWAARLRAAVPRLPIVVLTARSDLAGLVLALIAGVTGYLIEPVASRDVLRALAGVARGAVVLCQRSLGLVGEWLDHARPYARGGRLTSRERQLLGCLFRGLSDKEIAEELGIRRGTVHTHKANLYAKLGVQNCGEACRVCLGLR